MLTTSTRSKQKSRQRRIARNGIVSRCPVPSEHNTTFEKPVRNLIVPFAILLPSDLRAKRSPNKKTTHRSHTTSVSEKIIPYSNKNRFLVYNYPREKWCHRRSGKRHVPIEIMSSNLRSPTRHALFLLTTINLRLNKTMIFR